MKKNKQRMATALWHIYGEACACDMDHGTTCNCSAGFIAGQYLEELLGPKWHRKMCRLEAKGKAVQS